MSSLSEDLQSALQIFVNAEGDERQVAAKHFSYLLKKAKESKDSGTPFEGDCPDVVVDCSELVSPCCGATLANVFGTLPLQVLCRKCVKTYYLGELVRNSLKIEKKIDEV